MIGDLGSFESFGSSGVTRGHFGVNKGHLRSLGVTINDKPISQKHILQFDHLQRPMFHNELNKIFQ